MQTIGFNNSKLVMRMTGCAIGAVLLVFLSVRMQGGAAVPLVLAALFGGLAALSAFAVMSGKPAIELDERGITLNNLLTPQTVAWADVADIKIQTMTLYYLGFIPAARHAHLIIKTTGSWLNARRIKVSTRMMALPPGGHAELLALIEAARASAGDASRGPAVTRNEPAESGSGFDPDAAIARYLAHKETQAQSNVPPRPQFGRRGL